MHFSFESQHYVCILFFKSLLLCVLVNALGEESRFNQERTHDNLKTSLASPKY
jgi:hypothetical protein